MPRYKSRARVVLSFSLLFATVIAPTRFSAAGDTLAYSINLEAPVPYAEILRRNLEIFRWLDSPRLNPAFLRRIYRNMPLQVENIMASEGYFSPRIEHSLEERDDRWRIRLEVEPGARGVVSRVSIELRGEVMDRPGTMPDISELSAGWLMPVGESFRNAGWERAKRSLLDEFLKRSYPIASIQQSRALVDPEKNEVALELTVNSGPLVTLGELRISGAERYPEKIVRNLNFLEPGTPHRRDYLYRLQELLTTSGYYSSAHVYITPDARAPLSTPINVRLEEKKRQRFDSGIEYNSETGPGFSLSYERLNFMKPGWQWRNTFEVDPTRWQTGIGVKLPPGSGGAVHDFFGSYLDEEREGLDREVFLFGVSRTRRMENRERSLILEYQDERRPTAPAGHEVSRSLFLNNSLKLKKTDDRLFPSSGYLVNLQGGGSLDTLLSDRSFARLYGRANRYFRLSPSDTIILRGEAGAVLAGGRRGIPNDYLFRAGGAGSVRGYPFQSLGVKENGIVAGGRYLAVFSLEYNHWWGAWGPAVFSDWGWAGDELSGVSLAGSYGAGLRARTPVGLFNLDIAYGLERKSFAWHFSLGIPF